MNAPSDPALAADPFAELAMQDALYARIMDAVGQFLGPHARPWSPELARKIRRVAERATASFVRERAPYGFGWKSVVAKIVPMPAPFGGDGRVNVVINGRNFEELCRGLCRLTECDPRGV